MDYITINSIKVPIEGEKNVLSLIRKAGIDIPTFCYHSELSNICGMLRDTESGHGDLYEYKESAAVQKAYYRAVVILSLQRLYDLSEEWHVCAPVTCL